MSPWTKKLQKIYGRSKLDRQKCPHLRFVTNNTRGRSNFQIDQRISKAHGTVGHILQGLAAGRVRKELVTRFRVVDFVDDYRMVRRYRVAVPDCVWNVSANWIRMWDDIYIYIYIYDSSNIFRFIMLISWLVQKWLSLLYNIEFGIFQTKMFQMLFI